jgi:hypothetical protein
MGQRDGNVRIGTSEREVAVRALAEHLAEGRLDIGEYDNRCGLAAAARTRGELAAIFADLPAPGPFAEPAPPPAPAPDPPPLVRTERKSNTGLIIGAFVTVSLGAVITVTAIMGAWWALIPAILIIAVLAMVS